MRKGLLYIAAIALFTLSSCVTQERVPRPLLIAHAGGAIDGHVYTNSLEALVQATANGYEYIEFDLLFTSDSVLVAAHSWEEFNRITGFPQKGDTVPTFSEFSSRRIHGQYTPLSAADIQAYFSRTPGIYLVTDKISNPAVLEKHFPGLKDRMIVEAFSYAHYEELVEKGYYRVLYSCMASDLNNALVRNLLFSRIFPGKRIEWVALHTSGLNHPMFRFISKVRLFNIALFTIDNCNDIPPEQQGRAGMIYTNTILPSTTIIPESDE